ncbi:hypothetical protein ACUWEX_02340 [Okibacterium fritillariae]|uniref:hypothetical protein n=1 Tax=Okibacterium fritillariae TaxID=123320 RepID=UPI00405567D7
MTGKHAALNRFFLFLIGLVLALIGAAIGFLGFAPAAEKAWRSGAGSGVDTLADAAQASAIPGTQTHWVAAAAVLLGVIAAALLISWMIAQRQRVRRTAARAEGDNGLGEIVIDNRAFEQIVEARLADEPGIIASNVRSVPAGRTNTGVRVRITTRRGASPARIAAEANTAVDEAQTILGKKIPVLITVRAGARAALGHVQRVS